MLFSGKYLLRDKHSTNGTYVNNARLNQDSICTLRNLDQIRIGDGQCRFELRQQAVNADISSVVVSVLNAVHMEQSRLPISSM